jgi:hypothetical protein
LDQSNWRPNGKGFSGSPCGESEAGIAGDGVRFEIKCVTGSDLKLMGTGGQIRGFLGDLGVHHAIVSADAKLAVGQIRSMEEVLIMGTSKTTGKVVAPKNVMEACDRDDLELWIACWDKEMQKLSKLEHTSHGHTKEDLLREGIKAPPTSTRMISDAKYKGHVFDKRKGRMIVQGFKQMKNVHYDGKVFTPAPSQHAQKTLMALVAGKNLKIKSLDISQACTHGERVKLIALSYPVGHKKRGKNGEELFMIARKQHYGEKGAGRG